MLHDGGHDPSRYHQESFDFAIGIATERAGERCCAEDICRDAVAFFQNIRCCFGYRII
ncbi:MAG: Flavodoxin reductases (ferredoxin-NADPH reductases) family 1 [uncultured Paraburkholderia sp.]|nr:MAG: Flavodoxin reductases (ferredoxin-NADPH reductases) family 1 [uncultured Paraburkholderia sp.]CAH2933946.1 MAG: Flavodoxin reductases (ferredoxin-NADPH reductases) family 1 [uncultured Paraburkholderia sp.]